MIPSRNFTVELALNVPATVVHGLLDGLTFTSAPLGSARLFIIVFSPPESNKIRNNFPDSTPPIFRNNIRDRGDRFFMFIELPVDSNVCFGVGIRIIESFRRNFRSSAVIGPVSDVDADSKEEEREGSRKGFVVSLRILFP